MTLWKTPATSQRILPFLIYNDNIKKNIENTVAVQDNVESHLCNECEDMNILVNYLKKHIESFHEGVCYPCYQCDYKANTSNLKLYVKLVHEGVVHP